MAFRKTLLALTLIGAAFLAYMYSVAIRDPVIRTATIAMPDWPEGAPPVKVMLISGRACCRARYAAREAGADRGADQCGEA